MTALRDWLTDHDVSDAEFGRRIDRSAEAVRRYAAGLRIPDRETMPRIVRETGAAVTANDFFGILPPGCPVCAIAEAAAP